MIGLPERAEAYKRTPAFTESSVPAGLLNNHATREGTWGLIRVEEGTLRYVITDPRRPATQTVLSPDNPPGVVEPTILHRVEPLGTVRFYVEFYRIRAGSR